MYLKVEIEAVGQGQQVDEDKTHLGFPIRIP
jgi:hypothetical protein